MKLIHAVWYIIMLVLAKKLSLAEFSKHTNLPQCLMHLSTNQPDSLNNHQPSSDLDSSPDLLCLQS